MSKANVLKFFVLAVIFVLAAPANAQLTKYRFTGTATGSSNPALGTTVSGIVTIDSGTPLVDYEGFSSDSAKHRSVLKPAQASLV